MNFKESNNLAYMLCWFSMCCALTLTDYSLKGNLFKLWNLPNKVWLAEVNSA